MCLAFIAPSLEKKVYFCGPHKQTAIFASIERVERPGESQEASDGKKTKS